MKYIQLILIALSVAVLSGCGSITHSRYVHREASSMGGHEDSKLENGNYVVEFDPNGHTPSRKSKDYTFLRAAEITLKENYKSFEIINFDEWTHTGEGESHTVYGANSIIVTPPSKLTYAMTRLEFHPTNALPDGKVIIDAQEVFIRVTQEYKIPQKYLEVQIEGM